MRKSEKTRWIVGNALLVALCVVLTLISNYIPIGGITINLALITIALAAILYGYKSALFVAPSFPLFSISFHSFLLFAMV